MRDECIKCLGHNFTYECTVIDANGGSTEWQGNVFQDLCGIQGISFLHRDFASGLSQGCNTGAIVAYPIRAENGSYTSQLNITFGRNLIDGRVITCAYDNGTDEVVIGSTTITTNNTRSNILESRLIKCNSNYNIIH